MINGTAKTTVPIHLKFRGNVLITINNKDAQLKQFPKLTF